MEGEHPGFRLEDVLARDMARGKAAIEELARLQEVIRYAANYHPQKHSMVIEVTMAGHVSAKNFKDLLENYAQIVAE
jgi:hypothetical protein